MESHCSQGSNNTESCKRRLIEFTFEVSIGEDLRLGLTNVANGRIGAVFFFLPWALSECAFSGGPNGRDEMSCLTKLMAAGFASSMRM